MRAMGIDGNRFTLKLVDIFTGMIWTLALEIKSATAEAFNQWVINRNSDSPANYKIRRFHSDNG